MSFWRKIIILLSFVGFASLAVAQDDFAGFEQKLDQQSQSIAIVADSLEATEIEPNLFSSMRDVLRDRRSDLLALSAALAPVVEEARAKLADLGPEPEGENATPEPENIQTLRRQLTDQASAFEGLEREVGLELANVARLLDRIAELRRGEFIGALFAPAPAFTDAALWRDAKGAYQGLRERSAKALAALDREAVLLGLVTIAAFALWFLWATFRSARRLRAQIGENLGDNLRLIANSMVAPLLIFAGLGLVLSLGARIFTGALPESDSLLFVLYGVAGLLCFGLLVLNRFEAMGLISRATEIALLLIAIFYCADAVLLVAGQAFGGQIELVVAQSYVTTFVVAFIALGLALKYGLDPEGRLLFKPRLRFARWGFGALGLILIGLNLYGYPALARFSLRIVVLLLFFGLLVLILRLWARGIIANLNRQMHGETGEDGPGYSAFWFNLILDIVLGLASLPWLLRIIGTDWANIQDWAHRAFFGFSIGSMTISIANILIGLGLFVALLVVTRLGQRILANKVLTQTRLDSAMRQSIVQVVGYAGLALALLIGVASIGFDLTNVAIVAGALSVGIGFGLQSIVSNFVSGLILLFERPVKIGDWVATSAGEGTVRKISVRATEIETFDRNIVIVPNSELITGAVQNWTRHNSTGRIVVRIGVSYDADPHQVKEILENVGRAHPAAMKNPAPSVVFRDFGDSALIFDLRIFVRDINNVSDDETKLRFDIWDALAEAGIELSYPQQDIHIRSAPGMEKILAPVPKRKRS